MKVNREYFKSNRAYFWIIGICLLIQIFILFIKNNTVWIEEYYSKGFYPIFSYLDIFLFSWVPFSVGDIFYVALVLVFLIAIFKLFKYSFRKKWSLAAGLVLKLFTLILALYTFFYVNWGLNYFRQPIAISTGLQIDSLTREDYLEVLEKYIYVANDLREQIDYTAYSKVGVKGDMEELMKRDTIFESILSKSQINIKEPISSKLISYFTVSGYFNPFTSEVQVNQEIPKPSFPFTNVHELAHQMGIGFEDDCNFIAFRELVHHKNVWYRYSAYYNAVESLLRPLYSDELLLEKYTSLLSEKVKQDYREEYAFWRSYSGWVDQISAVFYNSYLQHNNQPEGLKRYGMMARLIVAWEKQQ